MGLSKQKKQEIVTKYQKHPKDSGTSSVQIALLGERISFISKHLKTNPKDHHSQTALMKLVGQRRKLQKYLRRINPQEYEKLLKSLALRK